MHTVLITGGTGMVGRELTKHLLGKGFQVIILTRQLPGLNASRPGVRYALWDVEKQTIDVNALQQADYIIHLAGAGIVDKRWSQTYKKKIVTSRVNSSNLLVKTLQQYENKVSAFISASAIGWYGEDPAPQTGGFVETDLPAASFLGDTCKLWEESVDPVTEMGKRLVKIRLGIVLSDTGGAIPEFKKPVKFGIAGILGTGRQIISWIHIDDLCRIFITAVENEKISGVYNAVAPKPVTNKKLTLDLAGILRGKFFIPLYVPSFVLKIIMGESSIEVLKSTTVSCNKIKQTGFTFFYPSIEAALQHLCSRENLTDPS